MRITTSPWTRDGGASLAVALEVLIHGPISRSEIARRLDLSAGSLTRLSTPLIDSGLLVEVGERTDGRAGRPSVLLDIVPESRHFIGMKITADEVLGVVTDLRANVIASESVRLASRDPDAVAATVAQVVASLSAGSASVTALGVGLGGLVAPGGLVRSAPFLEWTDVPLGPMLEQLTGLPTVVDNDLVAFTEYEHWFGSGRGIGDFAVLTLGAGIGFGLVMHDEIVLSEDSGIGLVGHWPLDPFGPVCPSGHRGCAKSVLEQGAIVANVSAALGRPVTYDEAMTLASEGEPAAKRIVDDAGRGLGALLAAIANLTTPKLIVLGGEGVGLVDVAASSIQEGIRTHRDPRAAELTLVSTAGDNTEWCRGAAVLAIQRYVLDK
ncbi:ROK family transcriptional regulator [soil metagenome]